MKLASGRVCVAGRSARQARPPGAAPQPRFDGGLRLISNGALDDGNIESLADRLGVTSRHLRRLFTRHLGASPLAVAHTQRLHFAKRLIDETRLPMSHVSSAAGYGSIRRFNDAFRKTYGRSPRELRKTGEEPGLSGRTAILTVRLPYRRPFSWSTILDFFAARATPGVEAVIGNTYSRTIFSNDDHGVVEIRPDQRDGYLSLTLHCVNTDALFETVQTAREVFDLDAPISEIRATLGKDQSIKAMCEKIRASGYRVPGMDLKSRFAPSWDSRFPSRRRPALPDASPKNTVSAWICRARKSRAN